jgi:hypothetical protein
VIYVFRVVSGRTDTGHSSQGEEVSAQPPATITATSEDEIAHRWRGKTSEQTVPSDGVSWHTISSFCGAGWSCVARTVSCGLAPGPLARPYGPRRPV